VNTKSYETLLDQYLRNFADYTLTEEGLGLPPVRVFRLRKPGHGSMEGVDLLFTCGTETARAAERIVVTGDLCPNDNQGCVSNTGNGLLWFAGTASDDYLCSKFLRKTWVPDIALDALRGLLDDARKDTEADAEVVDERAMERAHRRLHAVEEAIAESEGEPDGESAITRSSEAFGEWEYEVFHDTSEAPGFGYEPREAALLCAIQKTFARLYAAMQEKAKASEVWGYADSPRAERWEGSYATREEAIEAGRGECQPDDPLYVHRGRSPDPANFLPTAEWIASDMGARASDEHDSELVGDWPDVNPEALAELDAILDAWAKKHAPCTFWEAEGEAEKVEDEDRVVGVVPFVLTGPMGTEGPPATVKHRYEPPRLVGKPLVGKPAVHAPAVPEAAPGCPGCARFLEEVPGILRVIDDVRKANAEVVAVIRQLRASVQEHETGVAARAHAIALIATMLESAERAPRMWGCPEAMEVTFLLLVALRASLDGHVNRQTSEDFTDFVAALNGEPTNSPLWCILKKEGMLADHRRLLGDYARWMAVKYPPRAQATDATEATDARSP
jgi:hypothetical protein